MREITKIDAIAPLIPFKKRVAAYARVSTGKETMLHSLSAQVSYFSSYIQRHREWEFAGVYTDEAYTGTKAERPDFQRLMIDCRNGLIDVILTKSIARFARNTVTLLSTVRELKALGIDVYFINERVHSNSADGELMLSILASFAQEESRSVSQNCKWRIRKGFARGELVNLRFIYGYRVSKGTIEIDPEQAEIVRMIFDDYNGGMGGLAIAQKLRDMGLAAPRGGAWSDGRVLAIIKNEKYTGNALLQKKYVKDHLTKKLVRNKGELEQYAATGTHPAIIDADTFSRAQAVIAERGAHFKAQDTSGNRYPFSGKIRCGGCGKSYKRKITVGKVAWNCGTFLKDGKAVCHAKQIPEDTLIEETASVLGLAEFDAVIFSREIAEILVPGFNRLVYVFRDGREIEREWPDRSRRESWTDEMRETARQRQKTIIEQRRRAE